MSEKSLFDVFGGESFDPSSVPPVDEFGVLPPGSYPVMVEDAECKETKKRDGYYLKVTLSVLDGPYRGRKLWDNINVRNPSEDCEKFGIRKLGNLCVATGVPVIDREHSEKLLINKTCIAKVNVKDNSNVIAKYEPVDQPANPQTKPLQPESKPAPQSTQESSAPAKGKPIWNR